jgi:cation diffusion facilitator CzcD-associated flavoprotein CzcO
LNFALNPDWPSYFSYAPDILRYLRRVCDTFDLNRYMQFNTEVNEAKWNEGEKAFIFTVTKCLADLLT